MAEKSNPMMAEPGDATPAVHASFQFSPLSLEPVRQQLAQFANDRDWNQFHTPRNLLLAMVGEVGELSEIFQWRGECAPGLPGWKEKDRIHLGEELSDVFLYLLRLADRCHVDISAAALEKLRKNAAKYPADRCRGSSDKYTAYADMKKDWKEKQIETGGEIKAGGAAEEKETVKGKAKGKEADMVTEKTEIGTGKEGKDDEMPGAGLGDGAFQFSPLSLEPVRQQLAQFANDRDWNQFHTPRNLLLAMVGEVGELSEIFQWRGECAPGLPGWKEKDRIHLGEELSDVFLYLLRLADRCHVDISAAALEKLRKNAAKYPADRCRGSSDKYTAYANAEAEDGAKAGAGGSKGGDAAISSSGSSSSGSSRNRCSAAGGEGKAEGDVRVEAREDAVGDTSEHAAKKQRTLNA